MISLLENLHQEIYNTGSLNHPNFPKVVLYTNKFIIYILKQNTPSQNEQSEYKTYSRITQNRKETPTLRALGKKDSYVY